MAISRRSSARGWMALLLVVLVLNLAACSLMQAPDNTSVSNFTPRPTPGGGKNTIEMTTGGFVERGLSVRRGTAVVFVVRLDSGPHILCLGKDGTCTPGLLGPKELRQDGGFVSLDAGQTLTVVFTSPGVYPITCTIYPSMNFVITVT